ncbi:MAG: FAD-dependent oxidoreductase, partial [Candidatus Dormibacteraeota bacterium]|nr:FAD-dependent oxidoreductase [Candidatus Dormibacteraeota bacterium]
MNADTAVDLIVIGSGVAGLSAALTASRRARVAIVTKSTLDDGCTRYAQGGIAVAIGDDDSMQQHFDDTMAAGRGLCDPAAVRVLVEEGPARVSELAGLGMAFDADASGLSLGREAAHSRARIVHSGGDATGSAVETTLLRAVQAAGVRAVEHATVERLLLDAGGRCCGIACSCADGTTVVLRAPAVVLATGGASALWLDTTNPQTATGDGIALAYQAGADVAGLEFEQFHPTALAIPGARRHLISEAVRGEGAIVVDEHGSRFLLDDDPRGELAGRDVVARAIHQRLQRTGNTHVFLD